MRQQHDVIHLEKAGVKLRLLLVNVQAGRPYLPGGKGLRQFTLVHAGASRRVDEYGALLHHPKLIPSEKMPRLVRQRGMKGDDIALPQQLMKGYIFRTCLLFESRVSAAVVIEYPHPESHGPPRHGAPYPSRAHDAQCGSVNVLSQEQHGCPSAEFSPSQEHVSLHYKPGRGENEGECQVRCGFRESSGSICHRDATGGCELHVDVVVTGGIGADVSKALRRENVSVDGIGKEANEALAS